MTITKPKTTTLRIEGPEHGRVTVEFSITLDDVDDLSHYADCLARDLLDNAGMGMTLRSRLFHRFLAESLARQLKAGKGDA